MMISNKIEANNPLHARLQVMRAYMRAYEQFAPIYACRFEKLLPIASKRCAYWHLDWGFGGDKWRRLISAYPLWLAVAKAQG